MFFIHDKIQINGVFLVNIAKSKLYLRYRNCWKLFKIVRKESEFRYYHCRNSTKSMREKKKKGGERKYWISVMWILKFLCPILVARVWSVRGVRKVKKKKFVTIVTMSLPKMGGKKIIMIAEIWGGIKKKILCPQYFYNIFTTNRRWLVIISSNLNLIPRLLF